MLCFELSGCAIYGVAPCTGARIEMWQMRLSWQSKCRIPRGCANRNLPATCSRRTFLESRPSRVRESKWKSESRKDNIRTSHLTRVRESKCPAPENAKGLLPSHPARVRESKSGKCDYLGNPNVAPHAGARIEIQINPAGRCCRSSHLTRVRESKHAKLTCNTQVVAPIRVCESKCEEW